jgi:hypothetical protein
VPVVPAFGDAPVAVVTTAAAATTTPMSVVYRLVDGVGVLDGLHVVWNNKLDVVVPSMSACSSSSKKRHKTPNELEKNNQIR